MTTPLRRQAPVRATLLASAGVGMVVGIWSGLVRAGLALPVGGPVSPAAHGILMVSGFFGALISLERAVALDRTWAYVAPPAAALGALGVAAGIPGAAWASLVAALVMTAGSVMLWRLQPTLFMATMTAGAAAWTVAVSLDLASVGVDRQVPWLAVFLIATIVGERLELSRLAPPSPWKTPVFAVAMTLVGGGAVGGWRLFGAGLLLSAVWLAVFDVARRTVRIPGVTRFIAVCLLSGYAWLAVAGVWWIVGGDLLGTLGWDAALHAVFVGFVFAMVFGHVHMVAPAVLGVSVPYRRWFAIHLVVLHVSLVARAVGGLAADATMRRWGALGNAAAILLFIAATVISVVSARRARVGDISHREARSAVGVAD